MAPMTTSPPTPTDWHKLRAWAIAELAKRQEDADRYEPLHSRTRAEAQAALEAARIAYSPFLAIP